MRAAYVAIGITSATPFCLFSATQQTIPYGTSEHQNNHRMPQTGVGKQTMSGHACHASGHGRTRRRAFRAGGRQRNATECRIGQGNTGMQARQLIQARMNIMPCKQGKPSHAEQTSLPSRHRHAQAGAEAQARTGRHRHAHA